MLVLNYPYYLIIYQLSIFIYIYVKYTKESFRQLQKVFTNKNV